MALRLLELTLPEEDLAKLPELLREQPVVELWTRAAGEPAAGARVLLEAQHVETILDLVTGRFGEGGGFRAVLLPVEATLPRVEAPEAEPPGEALEAGGEARGERISREELYEDLAEASRLSAVYLVMVALSTVVAAVGLIRGDIAIIIGAMVIAPLLGPNIALSLACTLGDPALATRSFKAIAAGLATAAALSLLAGAVLPVDPGVPELAARTRAGIGDVVLALAAGSAGCLAFTTGVPAVVVGVMVAVALLPPLVAAGLLAGAGYGAMGLGALTLVLTNLTCINLAAVATFLVQRVGPRTWWEAERAKRATRLAVASWIVMLAVLLALMLSGALSLLID